MYSSMIRWALAPPAPKEETPAILGYSLMSPSTSIRGPWPCRQFLLDDKGGTLEVDAGIEDFGVQRGHELAVLKLQQDLGDPGDACGALQVADVGLDRADATKLCVVGRRGTVPSRKTLVRPAISIGSPKAVPVPWASR